MRLKASLLFGLLFAAGALRAETLTWKQCLDEARRTNPALMRDRAAFSSAQASLEAQRSPFLPTLSGELSANRANVPTSLSAVGTVRGGGAENQFVNSLSASQNFFNGGADVARWREARATRDGARWQWLDTQAQVAGSLKQAFNALLYAQEAVTLLEDIAARRRVNTEMVGLRFSVGRENKGSYLRTSADETSARFEADQARRALRTAASQLARELGRSPGEPLRVEGDWTLAVSSQSASPDFDRLLAQMPSLRRTASESDRAAQSLLRTRADFLPSLDGRATGYRSGTTWPPSTERWSIGATLSLPFFNGGSTWFNTKAAVQKVEEARQELRRDELSRRSDLEQAWAAVLDASQRVGVAQQYLEAAEVRADIARGQYTNGMITYQDWDLIESELISRRKARLDTQRSARDAEAAWERAAGLVPAEWAP